MAAAKSTRTSSPSPAPDKSKPIAIAYARCSTSHQENSVADQRAAFVRWARDNGHDLAETWADDGVSGGRLRRPGLDAMFRYLESAKTPGVVLLWDASRLSRPDEAIDGVLLERRITSTGWTLRYLHGSQRTGDGFTDTLTGLLDSKQAGDYRKSIALAGTRGLARAKSEGVICGKTPYGYRREIRWPGGSVQVIERTAKQSAKAAESVRLIPGDPSEIAVVRRIFSDYTTKDIGTHQIAKHLCDEGVPAPSGGRRWDGETIRRLLAMPVFAGDAVWNKYTGSNLAEVVGGKVEAVKVKAKGGRRKKRDQADWVVIKDAHEPLVARDVWDAAQRIRESRGRATGRARSAQLNPLTGILRCGGCGGPMSMSSCASVNEGGRRRERYVCAARVSICGKVKVAASVIEVAIGAALVEAFSAYLSSPDLRAMVVEKLTTAMGGVQQSAGLDAERREIEKRIARAVRAMTAVDDLETVKSLNADVKTWRARLAVIETESQAKPAASPESIADDVLGMLSSLTKLHQLEPGKRRILYSGALESVNLASRHEGTVTLAGPLAILEALSARKGHCGTSAKANVAQQPLRLDPKLLRLKPRQAHAIREVSPLEAVRMVRMAQSA